MIKHRFLEGLILLFVSVGIAETNAQTIPLDSIYQRKALLADLHQLDTLIRESHVDPFMYSNEQDYLYRFNKAKRAVFHGLTFYEFQAIVAEFLIGLQDSHTSLDLGALAQRYRQNNGLFLNMQIVSTSSTDHFILKDRTGILPKGSRLASVNGVDFQEIYDAAMRMSLTEGASESGILAITDAIAIAMAGLWVDLKADNTIRIEPVNTELETFQDFNYPGKTYDEWKKFNKKLPKKEPYELLYPTDSTAVMRIATFSGINSRKYYRFLRKGFKELRQRDIPYLAVDLRHNGGGKGQRMEVLFSHFADPTKRLPDNIIAKQSKLAQRLHRKSFRGINKFILTKLLKNDETASNYVKIVTLPQGGIDTVYYNEPFRQPKHKFSGHASLFTDGLSGSASAIFAAGFRQENLGPILGEPCLGPIGGTWGNPSPTRLNHTGTLLVISTIRFNATRKFEKDPSPIQPEFHIQPTPANISKDIDTVQTYWLELIEKGKFIRKK